MSRLLRREGAEVSERALALLDYLNIAHVRNNLAANLSYGQQKPLDFGITLMSRPEVILLDEPLAGVNPTMIRTLVGHIEELNARGHTFIEELRQAGQTILMVEQNAAQALEISDYAYVLELGENKFAGTGAAIRNDERIRRLHLGR